jgi:hypothetical protein
MLNYNTLIHSVWVVFIGVWSLVYTREAYFSRP